MTYKKWEKQIDEVYRQMNCIEKMTKKEKIQLALKSKDIDPCSSMEDNKIMLMLTL